MGETYAYDLPDIYNFLGEKMVVSLDLGRAKDFAYYDQLNNRLSTVENLLSDEHVNKYLITVTASLINSTYSESYSEQFTLTVLPRE